jgi:hypothetical protein
VFDPYHRWLAIPRGQRPPTWYQLLGVDPDETDPEVIAEAALRQTNHVRSYQTGPHAEECTALLNEIAQARATLTHSERRKEYDAGLKRQRHHRADVPQSAPVARRRSTPRPRAAPGPFDAQPDAAAGPSPEASFADPLALAYYALLLLGGLLAFWLGTVQRG